jgi:hypothetical protein
VPPPTSGPGVERQSYKAGTGQHSLRHSREWTRLSAGGDQAWSSALMSGRGSYTDRSTDNCRPLHLDFRDQSPDHPDMAKTTIVQVSDDLDGSANASEVRFAFEGTEYAIDLSSKNRKNLEKVLRPYMQAGTKVSGRAPRTRGNARSKRSGPSSVDLAGIRAWAKQNGHEVSDRGRLPKAVLDAYTAATS